MPYTSTAVPAAMLSITASSGRQLFSSVIQHRAIIATADILFTSAGVRVLPYHSLSSMKYASIEMPYSLNEENAPLPEKAEIERAKDILRAKGVRVLE